MQPTADPKSIRRQAQLSANDVLNMMKASIVSRRQSDRAAKLVKSIIRKLTLMQQQALESVWTQLSPLGQQIVNICFQRLLECINDVEERRRVLSHIESTVVIENRTLENSDRLHEFMREVFQAAINQQVGFLNPVEEAKGIDEDATEQNALQINAPMGTFSTTSSSDEDSKTGSEHSNE